MKNPSSLTDPNVYSNYAYDEKKPVVVDKKTTVKNADKKEQVVVVNNDKKKKKENKTTVKQLKNAIPKKLRTSKYEQTGDQQMRVYKNYIQPQLVENNTNDPNNDLVQSLKDVFGKDNKEELNQPLPSFTYENETVRQKLSNELFSVENEIKNEIKKNEETINYKKGLKRKELIDLVFNTPYKSLDEKQNLISNNLDGIVGSAKKNEKENKSSKIITRAFTKAINEKTNKKIQEGLGAAKVIKSFEGNEGMYVNSIKRGNKVVGLNYDYSPAKAERMQPRNLLQNFEGQAKPKNQDASTQNRGVGRPKLSSYKKANPENFKSADK